MSYDDFCRMLAGLSTRRRLRRSSGCPTPSSPAFKTTTPLGRARHHRPHGARCARGGATRRGSPGDPPFGRRSAAAALRRAWNWPDDRTDHQRQHARHRHSPNAGRRRQWPRRLPRPTGVDVVILGSNHRRAFRPELTTRASRTRSTKSHYAAPRSGRQPWQCRAQDLRGYTVSADTRMGHNRSARDGWTPPGRGGRGRASSEEEGWSGWRHAAPGLRPRVSSLARNERRWW